MFYRCSNSSSDILAAAHQNTRRLTDATQKMTAIDQQQHSCETLICQLHQTILRLLSSAATASTRCRVRELNCPTTYDARRRTKVGRLSSSLTRCEPCYRLQNYFFVEAEMKNKKTNSVISVLTPLSRLQKKDYVCKVFSFSL